MSEQPKKQPPESIQPTKPMQRRITVVVVLFVIAFTAYIGFSLFDVAIVRNKELSAMAGSQQQDTFVIKANRGTIYDRNNKVLAQSSTVWDIIISPGDIAEYEPQNKEFICKSLANILDVDYEKLLKSCEDVDSRYTVVKKKVTRDVVEKIDRLVLEHELNKISVYAVEDSVRTYPNGTLAASLLGFVNEEDDGYGVEKYYNDYLKGINGRIITTTDANGNAMPYGTENRFPAKDGNSLILTIDETLQYYLEKNLETTVSQHLVENRSTGIIMNCKTGAIVAMATFPGYDANNPSALFFDKDRQTLKQMKAKGATEEELEKKEAELRERQWKNKAISELYIPGSVFKVVTCASALEEEVVGLESTFECAGAAEVSGTTIKCWNAGGHGTSTLTEAMIRSCNPAFIKIGQLLGIDKFTRYFEAFGLTEKTGIDLPGEVTSLYVSYENMGPVELASSAFGQTNKITPMQMITAAAAAVNGGKLLTPYIVDKIIDSDGNVIKAAETNVRRQVISEETSALMRQILEDVVNSNGGSNAYMDGYHIGGKSGTAEKLDEYSVEDMRYISTFLAAVPANDPEYIMLVVVDEPRSGYIYGSAVAAPVVSAVFKEGLEYLNIYPQYTAEELQQQDVSVPYVGGYNSIRAEAMLTAAGLNAEIIGNPDGTEVTGQIPGAGYLIPNGGTVVLYMGDTDAANYQYTTVPNVIGMTITEANKAMTDAGLNMRITGAAGNSDAKAMSQSTAAQSKVYKGSVVEVNFLTNNETG